MATIVKPEPKPTRPWGMSEHHAGYFGTVDYRAGLRRFARPYVAATALIFIASIIGTDQVNWLLYLAGWTAALGSLAIAYGHPSLWLAGPVGALIGAILVRGGTDGFESGVGPLLLIPAIAVAIYGSRKALASILGLIAVSAIGIHFINDGRINVDTGWREDAMLVILAGVLGLTIHELVARMRTQRTLADDRGRQFETLTDITRSVASSPDPAASLCEISLEVTGADGAALLDLTDDENPDVLAGIGADPDALKSADPGAGDRASRASCWPGMTVRSAACEPVLIDDHVVGELLLVSERDSGFDQSSVSLPLLASEAAVAIQLSRATRRLERLAVTDALTGIANRRGWETVIGQAKSRAEAHGGGLCLALIDLDHFKDYNDVHGHPAGDDLLRRCGEAWQRELRSGDHIARYGGDEFAVSLESTSLADAMLIVDRLRAATPAGVTCSAGIVEARPGEPLDEMIERADAALYRAKSTGRNRLVGAAEPGEAG